MNLKQKEAADSEKEYVEVDIFISGCITITVPFYKEEEYWKRGKDCDEYLNVAEEIARAMLSKCEGLEYVEVEDRITGKVVEKTKNT